MSFSGGLFVLWFSWRFFMMSNLGFFDMNRLFMLYLSNEFRLFCMSVSGLLLMMNFSNVFRLFLMNVGGLLLVMNFNSCFWRFSMSWGFMVNDLSNCFWRFDVYWSRLGLVNI